MPPRRNHVQASSDGRAPSCETAPVDRAVVEPSEGLEWGLYTELHDDPRARALELATQLASYPRRSQAGVKRAIELALVPQQETYLQFEVELASHCFASAETEESFVAFRNRDRAEVGT